MNVQSTKRPPVSQTSKTPSKVEFEPPEKVTITRTFDVPVTTSERLGSIPSDDYEHAWGGWGTTFPRTRQHDCYGGSCNAGPVAVYRDVPVYNDDGAPKMTTITETLSEESYNQKNRSLVMAGVGAAVGVAGSMLGGAFVGGSALHPLAAGTSAVAGAVGGFALGYNTAAGDKVEEVWETRNISHPNMTGYTETIRPDTYQELIGCHEDENGNRDCDYRTRVRGYWHDYSPDISWRTVGTYERPTLQHTNKIGGLGAGLITGGAAGVAGVAIRALLGA